MLPLSRAFALNLAQSRSINSVWQVRVTGLGVNRRLLAGKLSASATDCSKCGQLCERREVLLCPQNGDQLIEH